MLRGLLQGEGHQVGRRHVSTLMKKIAIAALYRCPNTSKPAPGHRRLRPAHRRLARQRLGARRLRPRRPGTGGPPTPPRQGHGARPPQRPRVPIPVDPLHRATRRSWSTGSTTAACSSRSGTSRQQRPRQASTLLWKMTPWPRNYPKSASGKTGAVQDALAGSVRTSVYLGGRSGPRLTVLSLGWA
jgi:hypothetical protein